MLTGEQNEMVEFPKKKGEEKPSSRRAYTAARHEKRLWFGGVIPYVIDCSLSKYEALYLIFYNHHSPYAGTLP